MYYNSVLGLPLYLTCDLFALFFLIAGLRFRLYSSINFSRKPTSNVLVFISAVILFLLVALRYDVGYDYGIYSNTYITISQLHFFDFKNLPNYYAAWLGLPFITFCKIIAVFARQNYIIYHGIMALITVSLLYKVIMSSDSPVMCLFLYISFNLYYSTFNQSRQGIAILLVLYSYRFIREKQLTKFLVTIGFSMCFHFSSILAITFYILHNIRFKKLAVVACIAGSCAVPFLWDFVIYLVLFTNYSTYLVGALSNKYNVAFVESTIFNLIYRCCLFTFCALFLKQTLRKDTKNRGLYLICLLLVPLQVLAVYSVSFTRATTYVYAFYILLIPTIYAAIKAKWLKQLYAIFVTVFFSIVHVYYYLAMTSKADGSMVKYYQTFLGNLR